ncbi:uncharacterized protein BJ171DRAFT_503978 [Polychytrium aggregatum]|uniref:uncharacterized protein n=1 Tax=Polychytrium aggregatum TaxID=110093 RepID=UPI0022FE4EE8|nr:uncharacterized protein BJ171DRAFT_503978 [Polychytrium aggregatum]KAI9204899.1 hypothetical protein BJ171DRAFT_503978 [Polychytrium aggregatum]
MGRSDKRGKARGGDGGRQIHVENRDAFQRMNFLHQAACYLGSRRHQADQKDGAIAAGVPLASYYNHAMKRICRKLVVRLDPSVKRQICKQCHAPLIPTLTSDIELKKEPLRIVTTCGRCKTTKSLPAKGRNPVLFYDKSTIGLDDTDWPSAKDPREEDSLDPNNTSATERIEGQQKPDSTPRDVIQARDVEGEPPVDPTDEATDEATEKSTDEINSQ